MRVLHLTLKKQWFDLISSGVKCEEYREIKAYWNVRLNKQYDAVCFRNGYSANAPKITLELKRISIGLGIVEWGAPERKKVYILSLGKVIADAC
jgi:hypothetical protein